MQTQIQCPQCNSPVQAEVFQIIDVDQVPQLKQMIMSGQLNLAKCPSCNWVGQVAMPLVYHESEHDLLLSFAPMELNMPYAEQERMMGQLVKQVVDSVPAQKRRAYLLQPQNIVRWQTFLETVLLTEGVTPAMMQRNRDQVGLVRQLVEADEATFDTLTAENAELIDDAFVGMVYAMLQQAAQVQNEKMLVNLSNLQSQLFKKTEAGKVFEGRQLALHAMNVEAQDAGQMSLEIFMKHLLLNLSDESTVDTFISAVGGANQEILTALLAEAKQSDEAGDTDAATHLRNAHGRWIEAFDKMRAQNAKRQQQMLEILNQIVASPNRRETLMQYLGQLDESFLSLLTQQIELARSEMNLERSVALQAVEKDMQEIIHQSQPGEDVQFLLALLQTSDDNHAEAIMESGGDLVSAELLAKMDELEPELNAAPDELKVRFKEIRALISRKIS